MQSDSRFVVDGKIEVLKDITNLLKVKCLLTRFNDSTMEYCNRVLNKDIDVIAKRLIGNSCVVHAFVWMNCSFSSLKKWSFIYNYNDHYYH